MNARLAKEFRVLSTPILAALLGGAILAWFNGSHENDSTKVLIEWISTLVFFGSLMVICTKGMGVEFQQGTMPLILSQPLSRKRIWDERLGLAAISLLLICLGEWVLLKFFGKVFPQKLDVVLPVLFVVAAWSSGGFWTLLAGSQIGGMVFTLAGECAFVGVMAAILGEFEGPLSEPGDHIPIIISCAFGYSLFFLVLGRRLFARLELKAVSFGEGFANSDNSHRLRSMGWLNSSPKQKYRNLVRKEIRLQAPIFKIAALFVAFCFLTVALLYLLPLRRDTVGSVFAALAFIYGLLVIVLAATISLGEEKASGLHNAQLALPVSGGKQWFIKLAISGASALFFGVVLPLYLAQAVSIFGGPKLDGQNFDSDAPMAIAVCVFLGFIMAFWAVAFLENAVRAAFSVVFIVAGIWMCAGLGILEGAVHEIEFPFLNRYIINHQLPPDYFASRLISNRELILGAILVGTFALWQSYKQFARSRGGVRSLLRRSIPLALLTVFVAFSLTVYERTANHDGWEYAPIVNELEKALERSGLEAAAEAGYPETLTVAEVKKKAILSPDLQTWLKDCTINFRFIRAGQPNGVSGVSVELLFPHDRRYAFFYVHDNPRPL